MNITSGQPLSMAGGKLIFIEICSRTGLINPDYSQPLKRPRIIV